MRNKRAQQLLYAEPFHLESRRGQTRGEIRALVAVVVGVSETGHSLLRRCRMAGHYGRQTSSAAAAATNPLVYPPRRSRREFSRHRPTPRRQARPSSSRQN